MPKTMTAGVVQNREEDADERRGAVKVQEIEAIADVEFRRSIPTPAAARFAPRLEFPARPRPRLSLSHSTMARCQNRN